MLPLIIGAAIIGVQIVDELIAENAEKKQALLNIQQKRLELLKIQEGLRIQNHIDSVQEECDSNQRRLSYNNSVAYNRSNNKIMSCNRGAMKSIKSSINKLYKEIEYCNSIIYQSNAGQNEKNKARIDKKELKRTLSKLKADLNSIT